MYRFIIFLVLPIFSFSQNRVDEQGRKQGKWIQTHENGKVRYEGSFLNDKPNGLFLYYTETGILKANIEYFNQGTSASARLYHPNGEVSAVGVYQNEQKDLLWKYYNEKGQLIRDENYNDGLLHGESILYYSNGVIFQNLTMKMV